MSNKPKSLLDTAEKIGVIGSPSSTTNVALDILASAVNKKLVGELAVFQYQQEDSAHIALGQITEVTLRNVWHEDATMRSLIRQRGRVDAVSERQDTHLGQMTLSAVFAANGNTYKPSILGTVPATGTGIHLADDQVLDQLLSPYSNQLSYLGKVYSSKPKLPLWFKHFGRGPDGAGEAYHLGIFGKTGSGKSVLAKMIIMAYAKFPQMGILVIDPQGEFSKELEGGSAPGNFQLPMKEVISKQHKPISVYSVRNIVLDRWELFGQILYESRFFERLSISRGNNRQLAIDELTDRLKKARITLSNLYTRDSFQKAWDLLGDDSVQKVFYKQAEARERFKSVYNEADADDFYNNQWLPVAHLFREDRKGAKKVETIIWELLDLNQHVRPIIVIDLSSESVIIQQKTDARPLAQAMGIEESFHSESANVLWNDMIQALVIKRLLQGIETIAEQAYGQDQNLNTLVVMDEAHRLAPREEPEEEELNGVRSLLIDAVRTTRKYGLGWMFISQTLSSLHREIVGQVRIFFFGFGLSMGNEFKSLSELVGGRNKALDLYQLFRDPHSSFSTESREYSFMTIGPVSPLSFAGTPLFFNVFNNVDEYLKANNFEVTK